MFTACRAARGPVDEQVVLESVKAGASDGGGPTTAGAASVDSASGQVFG